MDDIIALKVRSLAGDPVAIVELPAQCRIGRVKDRLVALNGIPAPTQRLLLSDQLSCLDDAQELASLGPCSLTLVRLSYDPAASEALCNAARDGDLGALEAALRAPADPSAPRFGCTPLMHAALQGHEDVARALCMAGAETGSRGSRGHTALHYAALNGRRGVVEVLCEFQADVNRASDAGWTPLHMAALCGDEFIVRFLCESGADIERRTDEGATAWKIADEEQNFEAERYLRRRLAGGRW
mmetsp:Transcript_2988/g.8514  ORF Transcript_2988/g.8514 Transcript_2988/m.8514 type:complete len:242 (+) Transcript_2988:272-997(+)